MGFCRTRTLISALEILNIIYGIVGGALIGLGIWLMVDTKQYGEEHFFQGYLTSGALIFCSGFLAIIVAALGYIGTNRGNHLLLKAFLAGLLVVIVLQVSSTGVIWKSDETVTNSIEKYLTELVKGGSEDERETMNNIQTKFKCCGVSDENPGYDGIRPPSCSDSDGYLHDRGCNDQLKKYFHRTRVAVASFLLILVILEMGLLVTEGYLARKCQKEEEFFMSPKLPYRVDSSPPPQKTPLPTGQDTQEVDTAASEAPTATPTDSHSDRGSSHGHTPTQE